MRLTYLAAIGIFFSSMCLASSADLSISGFTQIGSNYIDFSTTSSSSGPYIPAPGSGVFQVTNVLAGSTFGAAGVTNGESGTIQSLNESPGPVVLPGGPFITFAPGGVAVPLTATYIVPGAVGPFELADTPGGATATFEIMGYIGTNTSATFDSQFGVFFPGIPLADLFTDLPINEPFCANISAGGTAASCLASLESSAAPEPAAESLVGAGLLISLLSISRRRARQ